MQFIIQLIQKIPAGWPRWSTLIAIVIAYFLFPGIVKKLGRHKMEKALVTEITQYLQLKKLYFEVQVLKKEKDLPDFEFPGEKKLRTKLSELNEESEQPKSGLIYRERFKYRMLGAATFLLITIVLGLISAMYR